MGTASIFDIPNVRHLGRYDRESAKKEGILPLFWACSGIELLFTGSALSVILDADYGAKEPWIAVEINGSPIIRTPVPRGESTLPLFQGMTARTVKHVRLFKETQPMAQDGDPHHRLCIKGLRWSGGEFLPLPAPECRIECIGDSLTSGEGLAGAKSEVDWTPMLLSASRAWPKLAADLLGAEFRVLSQSGWGIRSGWDNNPHHALPGWYAPICAAAAGEWDLSLGSQRPNNFNAWTPDAVIINLGTNDVNAMAMPAWHGPGGARFKQEDAPRCRRLIEDAALAFLHQLRRLNPGAKLVWVYGMVNTALQSELENAVERFRAETGDEETYYLQLPASTPETTGSRLHPGPACHRQAAETIAAFLKDIL